MNKDSHLAFVAVAVACLLMVYFMFPDLSHLLFILSVMPFTFISSSFLFLPSAPVKACSFSCARSIAAWWGGYGFWFHSDLDSPPEPPAEKLSNLGQVP